MWIIYQTKLISKKIFNVPDYFSLSPVTSPTHLRLTCVSTLTNRRPVQTDDETANEHEFIHPLLSETVIHRQLLNPFRRLASPRLIIYNYGNFFRHLFVVAIGTRVRP